MGVEFKLSVWKQQLNVRISCLRFQGKPKNKNSYILEKVEIAQSYIQESVTSI